MANGFAFGSGQSLLCADADADDEDIFPFFLPSNVPPCFSNSSYTFVEPLPDKYLCGICKSVLNEPHVTECCGQHFCKNCLEKSENQGNFIIQRQSMLGGMRVTKCPHCRQSNFRHFRYLPFKREIDSLKVYCPRKSRGCNVQPDYTDKNTHEETCEYVQVYCTNECGEMLFRKDLESHTENDCELRECTCELCGEVGVYAEIESTEHHSICPDVIIKCTNSCGEQFKRKDSESHNSICPEVMVACDFAEAGCQATPKRKDLDSHMDTNMKQHLSQLMKAHGTIICEHAVLKKQHAIMKEQHGIMKEENAAIKREFNAFKAKRATRHNFTPSEPSRPDTFGTQPLTLGPKPLTFGPKPLTFGPKPLTPKFRPKET